MTGFWTSMFHITVPGSPGAMHQNSAQDTWSRPTQELYWTTNASVSIAVDVLQSVIDSKMTEERQAEAIRAHKESGGCSEVYEGTSGGMEKHMALNMWQRSEEKNSMRYSTMVSDGEASTFAHLQENVDYPVEKEGCVNHVSKRLGTKLRKLKEEVVQPIVCATRRTIKKGLIGRKGKLTDHVIDELCRHYANAVRDNKGGTVEAMQKSCMSGLFHVSSADEDPRHQFCPEGEDSWCFFNRAIALGEDPPSHTAMKLSMSLNDEEFQKVKEVYYSVTTDDLMRRCLQGRTQYANESLHQKLWTKKSKSKFCGLSSLKHAAAKTVMEHNFGFEVSNVAGQLPFSAPTKQQRLSDSFREKEKRRSSLRVTGKKRKLTAEEDEDYGGGEHWTRSLLIMKTV